MVFRSTVDLVQRQCRRRSGNYSEMRACFCVRPYRAERPYILNRVQKSLMAPACMSDRITIFLYLDVILLCKVLQYKYISRESASLSLKKSCNIQFRTANHFSASEGLFISAGAESAAFSLSIHPSAIRQYLSPC